MDKIKQFLKYQLSDYYFYVAIFILGMIVYSFFIVSGLGLILCDIILGAGLIGIIYGGYWSWKNYL